MAGAAAGDRIVDVVADVVVVGAGPAGSTTALLLARRGYRVVLADRARFPRPKPCGEYLNPGAVEVLHRIGCWPAVAPLGQTLSGMYITGADGAAIWVPFPAGRGSVVPRDHLDHTLLQQAVRAGAEVIEECRVDAVTPGRTPTVVGRRGTTSIRLTARVVIGADGLRSVVARRPGRLEAPPHAHYTVGAHFADVGVFEPRGDLHLGRGWYAGAALYGHGCGNVVVALPRTLFRRARGDLAVAFARACASLPALREMMRGARRISPFTCAGPLGYIRRQAVGEGVLLVGDAAATINPMTGEGIFMALRSAELAAEVIDHVLRTGAPSRDALTAYDGARVVAFRATWAVSRALQWVIRRPNLANALFRRLADRPHLASALLGLVGDLRPHRS